MGNIEEEHICTLEKVCIHARFRDEKNARSTLLADYTLPAYSYLAVTMIIIFTAKVVTAITLRCIAIAPISKNKLYTQGGIC